jgi:hypothetical protein
MRHTLYPIQKQKARKRESKKAKAKNQSTKKRTSKSVASKFEPTMMNADNSSVSSSGVSSNLEGPENTAAADMSESGTSSVKDETISNSGSEGGSSSEMSLARQETKFVRRSKALICLALVLSATTGAFVTFKFLEKEDDKAMAKQVSSPRAMSWILEMPQLI